MDLLRDLPWYCALDYRRAFAGHHIRFRTGRTMVRADQVRNPLAGCRSLQLVITGRSRNRVLLSVNLSWDR